MAEQKRSADVLAENLLVNARMFEGIDNDKQSQIKETIKENAAKSINETDVINAAPLPPPSKQTNDAIWLVIVIAFCLVLLYSVWVLGSGVTAKLEEGSDYAVKSDTILTIVTTVIGFLAGLLAPSPLAKKDN